MASRFRVEKIFGISIHIDWNWLLIFLLVTWNLAMVFDQLHADWGASLRWGTALLASSLFFASVLAYRLAHSLVVQVQRVPVQRGGSARGKFHHR